ncbi:lysosomal protective protein-like [Asterias rubens]|uniref:lysosomal protective protein-like n=1 Tax=Asterias rubens TaxID=7604 RepID=UPI0014552332|nr:lysosomal protective protein-like [Asterias rubens]
MDWIPSRTTLFCLLGTLLCCKALDPDLITMMPGLLKQPSFNMYSGYLQGTATDKLHYWLINSQHASTDPLIIWLSGGPGCSALYSALTNNGPFLVKPDGINLDYNPSSWNLHANLLYIDAPVGTGFSYSSEFDPYDSPYGSSDDQMTETHYQALISFFTKYANLTLNDIYLAGDGYAGVYVPLLMRKLESVSKEVPLQFKGFAVGNAWTSAELQDNSFVHYAYQHGIIGEKLWEQLNYSCCVKDNCNFHNNTNLDCIQALNTTYREVNNIGLNPYKVNGDCGSRVRAPLGMPSEDGFYHYSAGVQHIFANTSFVKRNQKTLQAIPKWKLKADLTCVNATAATTYLNNPYVREALHITYESPQWQLCNATVDHGYVRLYPDMSGVYQALLDTYKYRILVFNGDQDAIHNFLGNQWFVTNLHRQEEVQWRPWLYTSAQLQEQVAGFVQEYDNIAFLTIKNAGFWTAKDQPLATAQLIYNFIYKRPF